MALIINGPTLLREAPIKGMAKEKLVREGMSYGLGEAGYDICIKQEIRFKTGPNVYVNKANSSRNCSVSTVDHIAVIDPVSGDTEYSSGRFCIASAIEEFDMPSDLVGMVFDKSSWARRGLSLFNTIIEPGWKGFLTLELVYHGVPDLVIPAGSPIAQVVFMNAAHTAQYNGKYQNQKDEPVPAIHEEPHGS